MKKTEETSIRETNLSSRLLFLGQRSQTRSFGAKHMGDNIGNYRHQKDRTMLFELFHLQCCSTLWTPNTALYRGPSVHVFVFRKFIPEVIREQILQRTTHIWFSSKLSHTCAGTDWLWRKGETLIKSLPSGLDGAL